MMRKRGVRRRSVRSNRWGGGNLGIGMFSWDSCVVWFLCIAMALGRRNHGRTGLAVPRLYECIETSSLCTRDLECCLAVSFVVTIYSQHCLSAIVEVDFQLAYSTLIEQHITLPRCHNTQAAIKDAVITHLRNDLNRRTSQTLGVLHDYKCYCTTHKPQASNRNANRQRRSHPLVNLILFRHHIIISSRDIRRSGA